MHVFSDNDIQLSTTLFQPVYEAGMALTLGLFLMFVGKVRKKNLFVIAVITIIVHYYFMKIKGL